MAGCNDPPDDVYSAWMPVAGAATRSGSIGIAPSAILIGMETPRPSSRRNPSRKRRPSTLTIPERVGPHVQLVFAEMRRQNVTYDEVEENAGVLRTTVKAWRAKNYPNLDSIEAVFGFLGWDFVPVPRERAMPPELVVQLRPVAERFRMSMPAAIEVLVAIVAGIHARFPAPPPLAAELEPLVTAGDQTDCRAAA